jgi:REP element-mobilizing transposase RayT
MKREKQLGFEILEGKNVKHFGGSYLKNSNPKTPRPISIKKSMHLVMRSSYAKGEYSFLKRAKKIQDIINTQGKAFGVKVYRQANGGNHLHLVILPRSRQAFNGFIRAISGLIARCVLDVERGRSFFKSDGKNPAGFWDKRPFTRIIEWGREFKTVSTYLVQNTLEALGFIPYQPRKQKLRLTG